MNKRTNPQQALKVAKLRCDAAVTITISGDAGSGKSTAAEIIAQALGSQGYKSTVIESNDSIYPVSNARGNRDDRLYLTIVEDSRVGYKPAAKNAQEEFDEDDDGEDLPPFLRAFLHGVIIKAKSQGM